MCIEDRNYWKLLVTLYAITSMCARDPVFRNFKLHLPFNISNVILLIDDACSANDRRKHARQKRVYSKRTFRNANNFATDVCFYDE